MTFSERMCWCSRGLPGRVSGTDQDVCQAQTRTKSQHDLTSTTVSTTESTTASITTSTTASTTASTTSITTSTTTSTTTI
ncbi:hypothetical protein FHG87_019119 [Trinorchestia longiramus]|nr:hypothetical protein FHG87_019119 [Trinorchestia longiramus]